MTDSSEFEMPVESPEKRSGSRWQFSLRGFMIVVVLLAVLCGWVTRPFLIPEPTTVMILGRLTEGKSSEIDPLDDYEIEWGASRLLASKIAKSNSFAITPD